MTTTSPRCSCGDCPAADCPGEWEPGCDLGANPAHVVAVQPAASSQPVAWIEGPHGAIRMNLLWKLDPMPPQSVAWSIPLYTMSPKATSGTCAAQPAPMAPIRTALEFIDKYSVNTIRTNSKDRDDWADDMAYVGKVAREALAAQPALARVPLTDEQIVSLWEQSTGHKLPNMGSSKWQLLAVARAVEAAHGITPAKEAP